MKKLFTSALLVLSALTMQAKDFKTPLNVYYMETDFPSDGDVTVSAIEEADKSYTFTLKNFMFMGGGVGTITVHNIQAEKCGIVTALKTQQTIKIEKGDDPSVKEWMSDILPDVPINMYAEIKGDEINGELSIDMTAGGVGLIRVDLGKNYSQIGQIPNSNFETFHPAKEGADYVEPNAWHSFMSATAKTTLISKMLSNLLEQSKDTRPGSEGKSSVRLFSADKSITSANGTMTTGRLNAGSSKATDPSNHSYLDLSLKDVDNNGDPFYTIMNLKPDAVNVWVKYHRGAKSGYTWDNSKYIYASARAIITDGEYYQDPEDDKYNNIVAVAEDKTIGDTNDKWKELTIPFSYTSTKVTPRAILVTLSTNAQPGGGSRNDNDRDVLFVDDLSLVYNCGIKTLSVKGNELKDEDADGIYTMDYKGEVNVNDIKVVSDGIGAYITKSVEETRNGIEVKINVTSNDLKKVNTYTLKVNGATTGIKAPQSVTLPNGVQAIYNLAGQQVGSMTPGQVYIIKTTDGQTKKVIKK